MINNEEGFTYPVTFILLLLMSLFLAYYSEQFVLEKKFFAESEKIFKQEYYMLHAVKEMEQALQEDEKLNNGTFSYTNGTITYNVKEFTEQLLQVSLVGKLTTNEEWTGYAVYDKEKQKMIKWFERR
ncbi:hypothetical protein H1Z61_01275 [Bacillus aquiflavi]|uniref:Competence protein ComG n=1 Tax=Bacillus aquiflavi TaxID=2672567 RepID=A0A6B3VV18_9BACI|nr:competence type IV pilus minor pilin ComGG [Bacillus aquiflavi]MBA4535801.1 hypothetical protein [Bacillus aquiflavi]NEY80177.1 hypothetical protein [Bacillus aquiflavi]UAC47228.1 hypothetical protein K6959_10870 [Bacillus aquiflavi]